MKSTKEKIEELRDLLHKTMDEGNTCEIIKISQDLDKLLMKHIDKSKKD